MTYQSGFNVRPSYWTTIAKATSGKSERIRWKEDVELSMEIEPYEGRRQSAIEWHVRELPSPELRSAVLQGIKWEAKTYGKNSPEVTPVVNFKVTITDFVTQTSDAGYAVYLAEREAAYAFSNALKQAEMIRLDKITDTGYWERADEQTKPYSEFQILPIAISTLGALGEAKVRHVKQTSDPSQYAIIRLRLEPYQGETDYWFCSDVLADGFPTEYIQAAFKGIKWATLDDNLEHGLMVNLKASILEVQTHPVDSNPISFTIAGAKAFREIIAKTPIVDLP